MKKFITLVIIGAVIFSGLLASSSSIVNMDDIDDYDEQIIVVSHSFPKEDEIKLINTNDGTRLVIDGFNYLTEIGKPMLPVKNMLIALPPGAIYDNVEIIKNNPMELNGIYDIMPYPIIVPLDTDRILLENIQDEWDENYKNTYYSSNFYPEEIVNIKNTGTLRKYSYVSLSVCPFRYLPESGKLFYFESCKIIIHFSYPENNEVFRGINEVKNDDLFDDKAASLFINFEQIKDLYEPDDKDIISSFNTFDYVIITTDDFVDLVSNSNFFNWKTELGFNVRIISISDSLITGQSGKDLTEQIRNFLREYYIIWGIKYVLLVGDYTNVPMRYCSHNPYSLVDTLPTDTYYADLSLPDEDSWDSDGDGYYGVYGYDNPDFLAEVYVGRIPTSDVSRISYTLDKIVSFEQDMGDWKNNALMGGAMLFYENEDHSEEIEFDIDGARLVDFIEKNFMNGWTVSHYSEYEGLSPSVYPFDPLTEQVFTADWRNGQYAVVNWAAHGSPASVGRVIWDWDDGDGVPENDNGELIWGNFLSTYSNLEADYPSIVFAVSCNVGHPEPTIDGNLGIDMLTKESFGAAVAVCSATRGAAVSANLESNSGAEALCYEFNNYMINGFEPVGDALYDSKAYVHYNFGWDHLYEFMNMYGYNLYGDPSMIRWGTDDGSPLVPMINGPINGKTGVDYDYTFRSIDPTEDKLFYYIDWGDGNIEEWIGPYSSGEEVVVSHKWSQDGTWIIKVKAKDTDGLESDWATLEVSMPKNKEKKVGRGTFQASFGLRRNERPMLDLQGAYHNRGGIIIVQGREDNRFSGIFRGNVFMIRTQLRERTQTIFGHCRFDENHNSFSGTWNSRILQSRGWITGTFN